MGSKRQRGRGDTKPKPFRGMRNEWLNQKKASNARKKKVSEEQEIIQNVCPALILIINREKGGEI